MIRQAIRSLVHAPAFSVAAILTTALGIGVNAAVFGLIYSALIEPLPFREPERLVHVAETHPEFPSFQVAAADFEDWRKTARGFEQISAFTFQAMNQATLVGPGEPERVQVTQASAGLFPMLGVRMLHGRAYSADEEARKVPAVVISEGLWRRKFAADPSIVGRAIRLEKDSLIVAGIVPKDQAYPAWADIWMPLSFLEKQLQEIRRFHTLEVVARLKPGVGVEEAQAEMRVIASGLARTYPATNNTVGVEVIPLAAHLTGEVRPALLIAWAAVALVLLLACANVAHLVMIRSVARSREIAVRAALGATGGQLIRLLLLESLLVAIAGGALGLLLAEPVQMLLQSEPVSRPVLAMFATGSAIFCAVLFALPALFHARRVDLYQTIKQSAGVSIANRRSLFGAVIIAAEVALAFVVINGAGLLYRSFAALMNESPGFQTAGIITAEVPLVAGNWPRSRAVFEGQLAPRLREIPGVTAVAAASSTPMALKASEFSRYATRFGVQGRTYEAGKFPVAQLRWVTPEYFATLGIPLTRGRLFRQGDTGFIINETMARKFFPGMDPVGRNVITGVVSPKPQEVPVIGVVADVRDLGLNEEPRPTLYSYAVSPWMTVFVRTDAGAAAMPAIRAAIHAVDPEAPVHHLQPLSAVVESSVARRGFALKLLGGFAALAAFLTVIGVYGVIRYSVSRRGREFAIRFAMGASRADAGMLVLRDCAIPSTAGVLAGVWLAYLFSRAMQTQLYKVAPADPVVLIASGLLLIVLVLASAIGPASRAAAIAPSSALRE